MLIDARGKGCPTPVIMAEEALSKVTEGAVEVLVGYEESALNVSGFASRNGMYAETKQDGADWKVRIVKGYAGKPNADSGMRNAESQGPKKHLLLIVGTDALGKDEELGKIIVKGFFDTMKVTRQLPHTIFFMNAGVKLTTVNSDTLGVLKDIENMGVEVYSCGTCLKYYNLEAELKVGNRGTTTHIVEGMQDFEKVVWI